MSEKTGTEILMAQSPSIGEVIDRLNRRLAAALERVRELEARLEIVPGHPYDGIDCRDETIRLADERIRELRENGTRLVEAADGWKIRCQAEEIIRVRVEAERDALREDAERYRWLREKISADMQWYLLDKTVNSPSGLDAAIDAERAK